MREYKGFWGQENYSDVVVGYPCPHMCHYTCVPTHRMYNQSEFECKPWTLVTMMCRSINYNRCITQVGMLIVEEAMPVCVQGYVETSVLSTEFCCESKTAPRIKSITFFNDSVSSPTTESFLFTSDTFRFCKCQDIGKIIVL